MMTTISRAPRGSTRTGPIWWMMILAAAIAAPAAAQRGIAVEARGGIGAGNYAEAASEFEIAPRPSFGATVSYEVRPRIEAYAGFSRTSFGCGTGFCADRDVTFTSTGVEAGVRVGFAYTTSPWVRAGIIRHSLDFSAAPQDGEGQEGESASGVGIEVGGGVELPMPRGLAATPGLRYVRYGAADDDGVAMLVVDVGIRIRM